jgi:D-glycero-alpha-D-manno-heptose-7-phosphate kinase
VILAKAPLRVSFFGGGSDIPAHFEKWGGATISTAINAYVYVAVMHTPHDHIKVSYSKQELVTDVDDIQNEIVRNALKFFGIKSNIEITSFADIPTIGNGLGGSSAFTCALIKALSAYLGYEYVNPYLIAKTACNIEIEMCGWKIGMQDQFASTFGGMNYIEYSNSGRVNVKRLDTMAIENYMILIPTNVEHHAAKILDNINFESKEFTIRELARIAEMQSTQLVNPFEYGRLLDSAWILKKQMSAEISSSDIDIMYDKCKSAGAYGAKLLGAGGGGYMLAITDSKEMIRREFSDRTCLDVGIAHEGARVVYRD